MRYASQLLVVVTLLWLAGVAQGATNTISASLSVLSGNANVLLSGFSTPSSQVTVGSSMTFSLTLQNTGALATGAITVNIDISGPTPTSTSQSVNALAALQSENVMITLSTAAGSVGSYTANTHADYIDSSSVPQQSNFQALAYNVVAQPGGGGGGGSTGGGGVAGGGCGTSFSPVNYTIGVSSLSTSAIYYPTTQTALKLAGRSPSTTNALVKIANWTCASLSPTIGLSKLQATNISVASSAPILLNVSASYPCSIPSTSIAPYLEVSLSWQPISPFTVDPNACTVSFSMPGSGGMFALLQTQGPQIVSLPTLAITYIPLVVQLPRGTTTLSSIGIKDTGGSTETVRFSIPKVFSNLLGISATNTTLNPGQSINLNLFFSAPSSLTPGAYVIPINISTSAGGHTLNQTEYVSSTIYVRNLSQPNTVSQINIVNNTQQVSGVLQINAPSGAALGNVNVKTILPAGIVTNVSQITTFGLSSNVSMVNGTFVINWHIDSIPGGGSVYGYYTINRPSSQLLLKLIQTTFVQPAPTSTQQIVKVINVDIPNFYRNTRGTVGVEVLYTGAQQSLLVISLAGSPDVSILNSTKIFSVIPNQLVVANFPVTSTDIGTELLSLNVVTSQANFTETIPLTVTEGAIAPGVLRGSLSGVLTSPLTLGLIVDIVVLGVALYLIVILFTRVLNTIRRSRDGAKYSKERVERLRRYSEQIKRSEKNE